MKKLVVSVRTCVHLQKADTDDYDILLSKLDHYGIRSLTNNGSKFMYLTGAICDILHNLVTFAQFKKREKRPWRSVTPPSTIFTFFKLQKWYEITQNITYVYIQLLANSLVIFPYFN